MPENMHLSVQTDARCSGERGLTGAREERYAVGNQITGFWSAAARMRRAIFRGKPVKVRRCPATVTATSGRSPITRQDPVRGHPSRQRDAREGWSL